MKKVGLVIFLMLVLSINGMCQNNNSADSLQVNDGFYLGLKVGLPYLVGLDMGYLFADDDRLRVYLNASAQTIVLFNSANIGAGYFLGRKGLTIGVRYNRYAHIVESSISDEDSGSLLGPELGWFKTVGKSKKTVVSFQLGTAGLNFSIGALIF